MEVAPPAVTGTGPLAVAQMYNAVDTSLLKSALESAGDMMATLVGSLPQKDGAGQIVDVQV
jgi:hypothetical protein